MSFVGKMNSTTIFTTLKWTLIFHEKKFRRWLVTKSNHLFLPIINKKMRLINSHPFLVVTKFCVSFLSQGMYWSAKCCHEQFIGRQSKSPQRFYHQPSYLPRRLLITNSLKISLQKRCIIQENLYFMSTAYLILETSHPYECEQSTD